MCKLVKVRHSLRYFTASRTRHRVVTMFNVNKYRTFTRIASVFPSEARTLSSTRYRLSLSRNLYRHSLTRTGVLVRLYANSAKYAAFCFTESRFFRVTSNFRKCRVMLGKIKIYVLPFSSIPMSVHKSIFTGLKVFTHRLELQSQAKCLFYTFVMSESAMS